MHAPAIDRPSLPQAQPGRLCPPSYGYAPESLARVRHLSADTLYVIGGLYGNRHALEWILARAAREPGGATLVFNGDFHWFDVEPDAFAGIQAAVLQHHAMRGNVETEIAGDDAAAGCGCAYPAFVDDAVVERSNRIIERLRDTARALPAARARLGTLPDRLVAQVGGLRVGIVHGDAESLAGWGFSQEALRAPALRARAGAWFDAAGVDAFASSHSCLPVMQGFEAGGTARLLANNGAAGMPNFAGTRHGLVTRIARTAAPDALYGTSLCGIRVEALPVHYDHAAFERDFLASWPAGSPAHASYFRRISDGPAYRVDDALRFHPRAATAAGPA